MNEYQKELFLKAWEQHKTKGWIDMLGFMHIQDMYRDHTEECLALTGGETSIGRMKLVENTDENH